MRSAFITAGGRLAVEGKVVRINVCVWADVPLICVCKEPSFYEAGTYIGHLI